MKKVLAVLLSVVMIFSAFTVSGFAAENTGDRGSLIDNLRQTGVINSSQVVLSFDLQTGAILGPVPVYNDQTNKFEYKDTVTGIYHLIPDNSQTITGTYGSKLHTAGTSVILPSVVPPSGKVFDGWEYRGEDGVRVYSAASRFVIPAANYEQYVNKAVIYFTALYSPAPVEGDIFDTLLDVLVSVLNEVLALLNINLDVSEILGGLF